MTTRAREAFQQVRREEILEAAMAVLADCAQQGAAMFGEASERAASALEALILVGATAWEQFRGEGRVSTPRSAWNSPSPPTASRSRQARASPPARDSSSNSLPGSSSRRRRSGRSTRSSTPARWG